MADVYISHQAVDDLKNIFTALITWEKGPLLSTRFIMSLSQKLSLIILLSKSEIPGFIPNPSHESLIQ